ncbi:hypothetical protein D9615_004625 [Tricholomella constricta]|uniref:Uncharacterized protein n=1 Tax=Tricholomella constricta TaxID=117010 RepID=A0A8H5HC07_9AGAR|nr:hypothetical protein D9615_004625 [Tricholomella constricta]
MPPKPKHSKPAATPSASRSLVPVGPRHVSTRGKNHGTRDENGEKPTTTRALILRNGKHGARGTGELVLATKLSGREKLDLLAEDLIEKSKTTLMRPFRLEQCLKIAESQCNAFLDDITNLRDPQLFLHLIQAELNARTKKDDQKSDSLKNSSYVASVVATRQAQTSVSKRYSLIVELCRIHNAYMLASAWKLVSETLAQLTIDGLTDGTVKSQLKNNASMRTRYLVLYDLVRILVNISQSKFSVLATTTPHYARYFKPAPDSADAAEPEIIFDWAELRDACVSFLDSIIIELCFPRAPYPKDILYQVLHDAVHESPKEAKRFPQELWNAVGDLSISVELQQLLEAPLASPDGEVWKGAPREMPEEYETWVDAQLYSEKASGEYANFKDLIFPLERTRTKGVLDNMWKYVNLVGPIVLVIFKSTDASMDTKNYKAVSGDDIDTLWGLTDALSPTPQWHAFYMPNLAGYDLDTEPSPAGFKGKKKNTKLLAIASGPANDSDDSMPELQSVSNSSDEFDSEDDDDSEEEGGDYESDSDENGYDTEEEDELREMLREAMDTAHEADWLHSAKVDGGIDPFEQDYRKGNPFLKLLGSLRGRMFSSSAKLKAATRTEPLKPKLGRIFKPSAPPTTSKPVPPPPIKPAQPLKPITKSYKATVEDLEDEDEVQAKKRKKKKPKKKKKPTASVETQEAVAVDVPQSPAVSSSPPPAAGAPTPPTSLPALADKVAPPSLKTSASYGSTASLPLFTETVAQSARSYIQAENLDAQKSKVKSRPSHATVFTDKPAKRGFFSKLMSRAKGDDTEAEPQKDAKHSWFSKLSKRSNSLMHQLLNTAEDEMQGIAPMKWDNFVKVLMREMGFEYDPSTAGSSVRFDPPDKRDKPITFHKPHPDPTIQPTKLKDYAKRLKRSYGWNEQDFLRQTAI